MLERVTITGADDSVQPWQLLALSNEFPFVEWGLLFSHRRTESKPRWPSLTWLDRLFDEVRSRGLAAQFGPARGSRALPAQFALHLCNVAQVRILEGSPSLLRETPEHVPPGLFQLCRRIQINTHGAPQGWAPTKFREFWRAHFPLAQIICQIDGGSGQLIFRDFVNEEIDAYAFHDLSHGAGVVPSAWPAADEAFYLDEDCPAQPYIGYGGGLGPDNLAGELLRIATAAGGLTHWVDMETKVRSVVDGRDIFDLAKVRRCLEIAAPFIGRTG